jgi:tRNA modification GTPase
VSTSNVELCHDTIVALSTPEGSGAIALVRMSGPGAWDIAQKVIVLSSGAPLSAQPSHSVHAALAVDAATGEAIDQVMVIALRGPRTFTGEDTIEITCHNNRLIVQQLIAVLIKQGARTAEAGEFTRRAVEHGKIDLVQAEAINELIHAQNQQALKMALGQVQGSLSHWTLALEKELLRALAWCEASFEFLDEEVSFGQQIREHIEQLMLRIEQVLASQESQAAVREGIKIALIGAVNAGKSSLFNCLIGRKRAIVTAIAGTTRDTIDATLIRHGTVWTLVDTAGIRRTNDVIEQEGIERSRHEADLADLVLIVVDQARAMTQEEQGVYQELCERYADKGLLIWNKIDAAPAASLDAFLPVLHVSTLTHEGIDNCFAWLDERVEQLLGRGEARFLLNERHVQLLRSVQQHLQVLCATRLVEPIAYELVSIELRAVLEVLTGLTGVSVSQAGMDMVFKEFCVGK